jgi:RNA polymerase sigma-B factor
MATTAIRASLPGRASLRPYEAVALLRHFHRTGDVTARERLVERYLPLVRAMARRHAGRGESIDDLVQIGSIALLEAIDRFDIRRGTSLTAFAVPTIDGRMRNYLRERTASRSAPRTRRATDLADEYQAALASKQVDGGAIDGLEDRLLLAKAFGSLQSRERRVLHLRFFADLTQAEIADELGLSQMHVSRLIRSSLDRLEAQLRKTAPDECDGGVPP